MSQQLLGLLFWNVQGRPETIPLLAELSKEFDIDVVALAESPISSAKLANDLSLGSGRSYRSDIAAASSKRITWAFRNSVSHTPVFDGDKVSIREVNPPLGDGLLLAGVHTSSRMARDVAELNVLLQRAASAVSDAEDKKGHSRTIVFGDFNLSPYDEGLISSESFHATMARSVALRGERVVYGESRRFFFNPMWKLLAEDDEVCGTFHYQSNSPFECFWYCFDQVLVRPDLLSYLPRDGVRILKHVGAKRLVDDRGLPSISDHLPILSRITLNGK